jgi:protein-S-isoprenylcysteine O-methyltransferase Ste14
MQKFKIYYFDALLFLVLFIYSFKISSFNQITVLGYIVALAGMMLWVTARYQLGDAFSILPKATKIIKTGIYKKIRHPVYMAGIIAIFGLCLIYQKSGFYFALIALIIMQVIRARLEEKSLTTKFGQSYIEYKNSTWF